MVQLDDMCWGVAVPLPPEVDNTAAELLAFAWGAGLRDATGTSGHGLGKWCTTLRWRSPRW